MLRLCALIVLAVSACSADTPESLDDRSLDPEPLATGQQLVTPTGWSRVPFVSGMSIAVPPAAKVVRPAGIDSNLLQIRGAGYRVGLDDYGGFSGPVSTRIGGRRASVERQQRGACRVTIYHVELPTPSQTEFRCERDGKRCAPTPGQVRIVGDCVTPSGCSTVQQVIAAVGFSSPSPIPAAEDLIGPQPSSDICQPRRDQNDRSTE